MRKSAPPAGWGVVKRHDDGGTTFTFEPRAEKPPTTGRQPAHEAAAAFKIDWSRKARMYAKQITSRQLRKLASDLGVSSSALKQLGVGWSRRFRCYTFPEYASDEAAGILTRTPDGQKRRMKGSHLGVSVPASWESLDDPVLIVEGPTDAAACLTMGVAALGRPANYGSRYLASRLKGRRFIVVGDFDPKPNGDWPGLDGALAVARDLADELDVPVRWAMPPDGLKDVRAWLRAQSLDITDRKACRKAGRRFWRAIEQQTETVEPGRRRFRVRTGAEVMEETPSEYQVEGLWPHNSFVVLWGPPGSGKSFIALSWSLAVLNGVSWLRQSCRQGLAVYIATEGQGSLGLRLRAWEMGHKDQSAESLAVITEAPRMLDESDQDELVRELHTFPQPPGLIVIDTMARALAGGDENSARDVGMFIAGVDRLRAVFGCTVLVVHHSGKDKKAERGSSALRGAADVMIKTESLSGRLPVFKVVCDKAKDAPPFSPIVVKLRVVEPKDGHTSCYLMSSDWAQRRPGPFLLKPSQELLDVLRKGTKEPNAKGLTSKEWQELSKLPASSFKRAIKPLKDRGFVTCVKVGRQARYSPARSDEAQGPNGTKTGSSATGPPTGQ